MGYYVKIHPENPQKKHIDNVAHELLNGGVAIVPTDTIYALAAAANSVKGLKKLAALKRKTIEKAQFSFAVNSFSQISEYTRHFDTSTFKLLKRALPGPYTFIMDANPNVSKVFNHKKKTIGIRFPNNQIINQLVATINAPLVVTTLHINDEIVEFPTDPELIYEENNHLVDVVVDGGIGTLSPSTIIDVTGVKPVVLREGSGDLNVLD